jgi:ribosomal protein S18 acetylase RimI-like enzyme
MKEQGQIEKEQNPKVILQKATTADIEAYIAIDKNVEGKTYSSITDEKGVREEMKKGPVYMIKSGDEAVGTISYERKEDGSVYIGGLAIDPKFQGRGFGRAAMTQVLDEVKDAARVWLLTHPENTAAVSLYESLGFRLTGRKENYFGDGEPRIVLTLIRNNTQP